jgi:multidrug resistance efflux pump
MWLSLGQDCIRAASSQHRPEIDEALGLAVRRWELLNNLEAQIPREEAHLAALERGRVPDPADEYAPRELLAKKDAAHRATVESRRDSIKQMKGQAEREREELEAFTS